jgi:hypothetical protein
VVVACGSNTHATLCVRHKGISLFGFNLIPQTAEGDERVAVDVAELKNNAAEGLVSGVQATRFATAIFFLLGLTGLSITTPWKFPSCGAWRATTSWSCAAAANVPVSPPLP